jgi:hypothetical protein
VLQALAGLGVPLATTNYDGLLEALTGRPVVTWRQSALFEQVLRGDHETILHLSAWPAVVQWGLWHGGRAAHTTHDVRTARMRIVGPQAQVDFFISYTGRQPRPGPSGSPGSFVCFLCTKCGTVGLELAGEN